MATPRRTRSPLIVLHHFEPLDDPRQQGKVEHPLEVILLIVFASVLAGVTEWDEMAFFGQEQEAWLRRHVPFGEGTPSADTIRRVFNRLNRTRFTECFTQWMRSLAGSLAGKVVAVDGKSVQGSFDPKRPTCPLHLLHVYATEQRLLLACKAVPGAPGEVGALPEVLALLDIEGAVITADANSCTRANTQAIRAAKADYALALKGNRGRLHTETDAWFELQRDQGFADVAMDHVYAGERGHGRAEFREAWAVSAKYLPAVAGHFADVQSVLRIERSSRRGDTFSFEANYYISSLPPDAKRLTEVVREHWGIENHLHGALDVVLHEDQTRVRNGPAAENLAIVRRVALTLLKRDTSNKLTLPKRKLKATLNPGYRTQLLTLGNA